MDKDESRSNELAVALEKAERRLADRETLLNAAIGQAETARAQYEQANERTESLRRQLSAKDAQIISLMGQLQQSAADVAKRDERIAALQKPTQVAAGVPNATSQVDDVLHAIDQPSSRPNAPPNGHGPQATEPRPLAALGIVLQPMDGIGSIHRIDKETTSIGRSASNDMRIPSVSVSRFHARIVFESDSVVLIDLQSTNGCRVNGERIFRQVITAADVIEIGHAKFKVVIDKESDRRSLEDTYPLLNDSAILIPTPLSKPEKTKSN